MLLIENKALARLAENVIAAFGADRRCFVRVLTNSSMQRHLTSAKILEQATSIHHIPAFSSFDLYKADIPERAVVAIPMRPAHRLFLAEVSAVPYGMGSKSSLFSRHVTLGSDTDTPRNCKKRK